VIIVPITLERFNKIVEKYRIYYHPMTYGRKGAQNIAFYVSTPISAITHLAKVTKIYINQPLKNLPGSELFAQPADVSDLQKVYYLEKVEPIRKIIKTDNRTVQGTLITSLEGLKKAKTISDILGRSRKISL